MNAKKQSSHQAKKKVHASVANAKATYRVLATQPLSVNLKPQVLDGMVIQNTRCRIAIRSAHEDAVLQRESGGAILAIEFEEEQSGDLIAIARTGLALVEDFLSAISIVSGATIAASELVQVARFGGGKKEECEFIMFKGLPVKHWSRAITDESMAKVRHLLAHWDGLESGHRLRRAALQYREAIGNADDGAAFQEAYIGLEAMEPPLAKILGLQPGTEEIKGKCESCGVEFTRKKTTLVGVRAFVLDALDPGAAETGRKADWKLINGLRNDLMHGLVDPAKIGERVHSGLVACMHHLHASICLASHAVDLINSKFLLARGGPIYLIAGTYKAKTLPALENWNPVVGTKDFAWAAHDKCGFVPELSVRNDQLDELQLGFAVLSEPLSFASMRSIRPVRYERG